MGLENDHEYDWNKDWARRTLSTDIQFKKQYKESSKRDSERSLLKKTCDTEIIEKLPYISSILSNKKINSHNESEIEVEGNI